MIIKKITLKNFRNIENAQILPHEKMNVISGNNAQGKTNLIEAIWLFTGAKSFRGATDSELIKINELSSSIEIEFENQGIENNAKILIGEKKHAFFNDKKLNSTAYLAGKFNAIVFSPTDLNLINGSPAIRRKFIDTAIGSIYPAYIEIIRNYARAVMQRNNILKESFRDATLSFMLDDYEEIIAKNGEKIIKYRQHYIEKLNKTAPEIYKGISSQKEFFDIEYIKSCDENLLKNLKQNRKNDILRGITSVGPHRDDILFKINNLSSREYASQGQKRSVALTLKLSEAQIIKDITGNTPIALLDDVMSELDKSRQEYILNHIKNWQVFLSCCEKAHFEGLESGKIFNVKDGNIF